MATIRILPDLLANRIAAGEVVERPAAVVKELLENALDARADRIVIDVADGGRSLVQVADNGHGMALDDALLSLERFATSKLAQAEELFAIRSLGFRGEALPSIAAVSQLTLITRTPEATAGVKVEASGGVIQNVSQTGAPQGTLVRVARLFYNTPARRKFLKGRTAELGHIVDTVAGMALGWPQVHLQLNHNERPLRQWSRVADAGQRVLEVLGSLERHELLAVEEGDGELVLRGFVAVPRLDRATARAIYIFVNNRRVRDRVVQHALLEGFQGRLLKGRFPAAVLYLQLPCEQVDVNVHPAKHEVRFAAANRVHALVRAGVSRALATAEKRLWTPATPAPAPSPAPDLPAPDYTAPGYKAIAQASTVAEPPAVPQPLPLFSRPEQAPRSPATEFSLPADVATPPARFSDLTVLGQFRGTYLVCRADDEALIIIDQHAAHERIVYERLARGDGRREAQRLLLPVTLDLALAEAHALEPLLEGLNRLGLEIEPFGGTTFVVKSVPVLLEPDQAEALVRRLAENALENGVRDGLEQLLDQCRMLLACHRSLRAGQRLEPQEIEALLAQLDACQRPGHCPHGRPTWIRWTVRDLEKAFGRVV